MAAIRRDVLEASQVRIYSDAGAVMGAGFLIAADVVCTCAHVIARAARVPDDAEVAPEGPVDVDFPLLRGRPRVRATVVSWRHGGADVALLQLDAAVEGARPVQLVDGTGVWGHSFRVLGYPAGLDAGVWASGTLRAGQGAGWLQMEAHEPGPRIVNGFSGAPVWDDAQDGVVGMTVAAHRGERTAYLLPSAELIDDKTLRPRCPFRGLMAFGEDDAEFFHGRDRDTARVHEAVRKRSLTLLTGPSGCGKSSLIRAGVLPRLRGEGVSVTELRPVPGMRAATVMARALIDLLEPELGEIDRLTKARELAGLLETGDEVAAELRARVLAGGGGTGHVLFIDQLEEYAGAAPDAARALFGWLVALAGREGTGVLRVVATARSESLDVLVTADTSDLVSEAVQLLAPLTDDALARAVTAPVDAVPGLWFEPGLPERIVADAGDEPGRMSLVQFALTELWNARTRSMLTHAAYDALGGVAGALVTYADDALAELTPAQQECARRLFIQLARPTDGDTFSRRPTRAVDLAPELLALAQKLSPGKLVVLSHAPGDAEQGEIVDMAHEALTALWPRLHQWLIDSRSFRRWQEQLRADLRRWEAQHREPARLLSGTDLAEADRRRTEHPQDISADELTYIRLSRRHARRGARLRQTAVAALAVLTVLAVVLALSTWQGLKRTEQQLRTQAAGLLAQAAEDRPGDDPATALQLALAAWNTKQTDKTRQALLHQYARGQYLVGSYPSVWQGPVTGMDATPDARVLVVQSKPGGGDRPTLTVVTGVLQGKPQSRKLSGAPKVEGMLLTSLSPDGRFFAATGGADVRLWRLSDPQHPTVLKVNSHTPEKAHGSLDFSSDGKRLLLMTDNASVECRRGTRRCTPAFAEAWQTPSGVPIRVPKQLVPKTGLKQAAFTSDADTVATIRYIDNDGRGRLELRDFTSGRLRYASPRGSVDGVELLAGGELLVQSSSAVTSYAVALGSTPGSKTELPTDGSEHPDATGRYGVVNAADFTDDKQADRGYTEPTLTDLRTGRTYRTRIPTPGHTNAEYNGVAAVPRTGGGLTVLVPIGTALMAVRAEPAGSERFQVQNGGQYAVSPNGRHIAKCGGRLEVLDAARTRRQSVALPSAYKTVRCTWTSDSKRIVVWHEQGNLSRSYSAQDLGDGTALDNVLPKTKKAAGIDELRGSQVDMVAPLQGSEIVVLTVDGRLARINTADGSVPTEPFLVHPAPNWDGLGMSEAFGRGQLIARPEHPGQVAVVTRKGTGRGEILLWDVRAPRHINTLKGPAIGVPYSAESLRQALAFDADGSRLATQNSDGRVRVRDIDHEQQPAVSVPGSVGDHLVGFGPKGSLITYDRAKQQVRIHRLSDDNAIDTLAIASEDWATGEWIGGYVHGTRLTVETGTLRQIFDLRPEEQFRVLCAAAGRDYTKAERKLLPEGTPSEPPCS
ncbi:serine protease [Streptomyces sp. MK37H]|uniref:serine protease n=1 Tax=Streptomyces sp. MK37H TaxID=2699117 RepID=UPI001B38CF47|nr:serine protease [Streptomyces sp. MK37H]MBP8534056.1 AAA family ATPase [Streptomyces sp. MK37H]